MTPSIEGATIDLSKNTIPTVTLVPGEPSAYWCNERRTDDDAKGEIQRALRQLASGHYDASLAAGALWCLIVAERERAVERFANVLQSTRPLPPMPAEIAIRDVLQWVEANAEVVDGRRIVSVEALRERWERK